MRAFRRMRPPAIVFIISCIVSIPSFFDAYRITAFNVLPRDDYAPFLLLLSTGHGIWPGSPFGYRLLSIVPAIPLYWVLPLIKFSKLPNQIDPSYLKATEALVFLSFLSVAAASTIAFEFVRLKIGGNLSQAGLTAALTMILARFFGLTGTESFSVFVIFLLLCLIEKTTLFSLAVLPTAFVNEKIALFFLFLMVCRAIFVSGFFSAHRPQIFATIAAALFYVVTLITIRLPGNEYQTTVSNFIPQALYMIRISVASLEGIDLNLLPLLVITIPCLMFSLLSRGSTQLLARSDFLVPLGLFGVSLAVTTGFTVGRIVALSLPLTVFSCTFLVLEYDQSNSAGVRNAA